MKTKHKKLIVIASALAVVLLAGFGVNSRLNLIEQKRRAALSLFAPEDAYGRSIHVEGMRRGIIDEDGALQLSSGMAALSGSSPIDS